MANTKKGGPRTRRTRRRRPKRQSSAQKNQLIPLHKRTASHFERSVRQRGAQYSKSGRVSLEIDSPRLLARVRTDEGKSFGVGVNWSRVTTKRNLHAFCQCQRFASGKPCEHLWAALLTLEDEARDSQPPGADRLSLRKDRPARWKELEGSAGGREGRDRPGQRAHGARPVHRGKGRSGAEPDAAWRSQLGALRKEMEQLAADAADADAGHRDPELRLLVNTAASDEAGGLVLDLFRDPSERDDGSPGQGGNKGGKSKGSVKPKPASLDPEELEALLFPAPAVEADGDGDDEATDGEAADGEAKNGDGAADGEAAGGEEAAPGEAAREAGRRRRPLPLITALPPDPPGRRGRGRRRRGRGRGRSASVEPGEIQRLLLPPHLYERVVPRLCAEGLLGWWNGRSVGDLQPLSWDDGTPWRLALHLEISEEGVVRLRGALERDERTTPLTDAEVIVPGIGGEPVRPKLTVDGSGEEDEDHGEGDGVSDDGAGDRDREGAKAGLVVFPDRVARIEATAERDLPWLDRLGGGKEITIPRTDLEEALTELLELPALPRLEVPEELQLSEERSPPRPHLVLESEDAPEWLNPPLRAELSFVYGDLPVSAGDPRRAVVDRRERTFLRRDMEREHHYLLRLLELDLRPVSSGQGHELELDPAELPRVAEPLLTEGWEVEVHGTSLRPSSPPSFKVESGVDWFELQGSVDFEGETIDMAKALAAVSRGERIIELQDGSQGLLPKAWVDACDSLTQLAHDATDDGLRFLPSQALLVDALLTTMPPAKVDRPFAELRRKLQSLDRIKPKKELASFQGTLRGYQRQGLGWLDFLREFGLGGVLADDMGLGKTVQVLALILAYRTPKKTTKLPFLVVAPRSLVYNWIDEARRFTPKLSVVEYTGPDREELRDKLDDYDLVLTTYGTLRRDVGFLAKVELDTVILDEAQAIKNRDSQSAKAARLLVARHRLALTGTPIENHLGELGSILEFLNPGLLGRLPAWEALATGRTPSKKELKLISDGMRPFILRRTKAQVLPDLPPKTELTLHCNLRDRQRELYDQLRAHYRTSLLERVESQGLSGSTFQVLEALLRLRQVACHPGLVDTDWEEEGSAKLETLFDHVSEVLDEGHKVIVFSQFTRLLAYVRKELDRRETAYAYLDGQTRNRGEVVERFQTDPDCNLFLISLKAGGTGLNLTAAGYVFLLDPWWNPAVEAQAIDRAHRIGQTQPVFAYRLIARDTVEEKILDLQRSKRELADAILEGDGKLISDLTADDLRMLLS